MRRGSHPLRVRELKPLTQKDEFDTFAVVTKAEVEDENPMVKYTAQGLTAYLGDVSTGVSGEPSAPPWQDKVDQIKPEIEGDIFGPDAVFGDTTAVPVMVVQAQFHANLIRVLGFTDEKSEEMRPLSGLINLAGVQYQCRKIGGEWGNLVTFSAGETPQTPGGWTFDDSANRVHWYSFGVDAGGSAVAYPLEYRVRLVMSSGDVSQWSAVQSSTASVIENGDIAANAITANNIEAGAVTSEKIAAGTLDALFIQSEQVTLSSNAADPKNPKVGDKKIDITKDGLKFYECTTKGVWNLYSTIALDNSHLLSFASGVAIGGNLSVDGSISATGDISSSTQITSPKADIQKVITGDFFSSKISASELTIKDSNDKPTINLYQHGQIYLSGELDCSSDIVSSKSVEAKSYLKAGNYIQGGYLIGTHIRLSGNPTSTTQVDIGGYANGVYNIKCYVDSKKRAIGTARSSCT